LPPWLHRVRRQTERDDAIPAAAWLYAEERNGRVIAKEIAAHCRRLPPPRDPGRPEIERMLVTNRGKAPAFGTICAALAGLT